MKTSKTGWRGMPLRQAGGSHWLQTLENNSYNSFGVDYSTGRWVTCTDTKATYGKPDGSIIWDINGATTPSGYTWALQAAAVDNSHNVALGARAFTGDVTRKDFVSLLDANADSVWNRTIRAANTDGYGYCDPVDMIIHNDYLYVLCRFQGGGSGRMSHRSMLVIKYSMTGTVTWARVLRNTETTSYNCTLVKVWQIVADGSSLYITGVYLPDAVSDYDRQFLMRLGTDGTLHEVVSIYRGDDHVIEQCGVAVSADGLITAAAADYNGGSILTGWNSTFTRQYRKTFDDTEARAQCCAPDGLVGGSVGYSIPFLARITDTGSFQWANNLDSSGIGHELWRMHTGLGAGTPALIALGLSGGLSYDPSQYVLARLPMNGSKTGNHTIPAVSPFESHLYEYQTSTTVTTTSTDTSILHADISDEWLNTDAYDLGFTSTAATWDWTTTTFAHPIVRF